MSTKLLTAEDLAEFTPPSKAPQLLKLAEACQTGACNVYALLRALGAATEEVSAVEASSHPAIKVCLGQLSFLCGESFGPTVEACHNYEAWVGTIKAARK